MNSQAMVRLGRDDAVQPQRSCPAAIHILCILSIVQLWLQCRSLLLLIQLCLLLHLQLILLPLLLLLLLLQVLLHTCCLLLLLHTCCLLLLQAQRKQLLLPLHLLCLRLSGHTIERLAVAVHQ
jgi:hypothetical protein